MGPRLAWNSRAWRFVAAAGLLLALLFAPSFAFADESSAEQLFQEGLAAMKRNDYPVACEAFAASNKADPSPGTQINLAVCFEKQKKWASSWTWYRSALGLAQQRNQREREQLAAEASDRIKPLIHYVIISVKEPLTDLVVKRDGSEVTIAVAGKEIPLPTDPGDHTIEVSARGKKPWTKQIHVADNPQTERLDVPKLEDAPVDETKVGAGTEYRPPVIVTNDGSTQRTVGIVVGAFGLLSGLASGGLFILANSEAKERDKQRAEARTELAKGTLDGQNQARAFNESADSHQRAAKNNELIALILGGGAVVLVGVGAVLYLTAPKGKEASAKPRFFPVVGPGYAGAALGATF